jgi:hypothetical protein
MMSISVRGVALLTSFLICAPAVAQTAPPAAAPAPAPAARSGMDEVVCQKQPVLGSRLQSKRVCRTRAEWADLQHQDRQELEQRQTQKPMRGY